MKNGHLQVGIDFSQKKADFCLLHPDGEPIEMHRSFSNSLSGFGDAHRFMLEAMQKHDLEGISISGEATSYYWLPFFRQLEADKELAAENLKLYLQNPRWIHWYKKCFAKDDKTDAKDPFYIADYTRTKRPIYSWESREKWLVLRFYTRLRKHFVQALTAEKNYFLSFLFLRSSSYKRNKPFSDIFGVTSSKLLTEGPSLEELATLSLDELADYLHELSEHSLPDPFENARRLKQALSDSFSLGDTINLPLQRILGISLKHISYLEKEVEQIDQWIKDEMETNHPEALVLTSIPGIGPVFSAGIVAEIGGLERFFEPRKWDKKRKQWRNRNLRDVEDAVAKMAGLWWPRSSSGDFEAENRRLVKSSNHYLRYYIVQAANAMRTHIPEYKRFYNRKYHEASKHKHKRALVLTARKSIGLFVGLLHRNEPFRSKEN